MTILKYTFRYIRKATGYYLDIDGTPTRVVDTRTKSRLGVIACCKDFSHRVGVTPDQMDYVVHGNDILIKTKE